MVIHASLSDSDAEVLLEHCESNRISVSALVKTLVTNFLDTNDKEYVNNITNEAKKIKPGRPRKYY